MKNISRTKIKVFLVDDHPVVREGVRSFLSSHGLFLLVGEASDDKEALRKLKKITPDVIILDISLPSLDGGELARRLRQTAPNAKLIAFSVHAGQEYVVRMARCGAHGYVMKDAPTAKLVEAIRHVHQGGLYFPSEMSDAILAPGISVRTAETHREHLSHKLNITTIAGLTKYAIQHGLTSLRSSTPAKQVEKKGC